MFRSVDEYRAVFGFPVIDYYRRAGFDFTRESFDDTAVEYHALYYGENSSAALFPRAAEILGELQKAGYSQCILSASESTKLLKQIKPFGIEKYFDEILGISDILASGKIETGRAYMERAKPGKALLVGDTAHDAETARAVGADCVLIAGGHQAKETLETTGAPVIGSLSEIINFLAAQ